MKAWFVIPGEPRGKGRPRFGTRRSRYGGTHFSVYTPDETAAYENLVKIEYKRQAGGCRFPDNAPIKMLILAFYSIPKSASKKRKAEMLKAEIRPTKKPDVDNVAKVIADSLNGIAYRDDAQIVDCTVQKFYSEDPRVEVTITGGEDGQEV